MKDTKYSEADFIINADGSAYHLKLRPEQLPKKIITVGDPNRVAKVSRFFTEVHTVIHNREFVSHIGNYKGKELMVISTGMGTDNIEIFMNELDALVNIDFETRQAKQELTQLEIVRIGTSGSFQNEVPIDAILASETAIGIDTAMMFYRLPQSDLERKRAESLQAHLGLGFTPYVVDGSAELRQRIAPDAIKGNTLTCPGFYAPQGRVLRYDSKIENLADKYTSYNVEGYKITNLEMETSGYYAMGKILNHKVLSLNAIVAHRVQKKFSTRADEVIDAISQLVIENF